MLSNHSEVRDEHGLPIVRRFRPRFKELGDSIEKRRKIDTWIAEHNQLRCFTEKARNPINEILFIERWMQHLHLHNYPATRSLARVVINSSNDKSIQQEVDHLEKIARAATARREELARASAILLEHAVSDILDKLSPRTLIDNLFCPPQGLLRFWGPESHTKYDEQLGFRCSSWTTCKSTSDFGEMKTQDILSITSLKSHCENQHRTSDWISLSGEASWMLKYIKKHGLNNGSPTDNTRIALISTAKLEKLGLLFDRSDFLLRSAEGRQYGAGNQDGVKFTWASHYLVYGWIPAQCIVTTFTLAKFRSVCEDCNIGPG